MSKPAVRTALCAVLALLCAAAPASAGTFTPRIVNGIAGPAVPWQVALVTVKDGAPQREADGSLAVFCGGTVRDATHVITAAHCLPDTNANEVGVVAQLYSRADTTLLGGAAQGRLVTAITSHPLYTGTSEGHDLAILTLASPLTLNQFVRPLPVVAPGSVDTGRVALISGWGTTSSKGTQPLELHSTLILHRPDADCGNYAESFKPAMMLCAGFTDQQGLTYDTCQGDSGGPLARTTKQQQSYSIADFDALSGVVSFGRGCAEADFPGIYTRLANADYNQRAKDPNPPARLEPGTPPTVTGTPTVGQTVACTGETWSTPPASRAVAWISAKLDAQGKPTDGRAEGVGDTLALTAAHAGRIVTCDVFGVNAGGARSAQAKPVAVQPAPTGGGGTGTGTGTDTGTGQGGVLGGGQGGGTQGSGLPADIVPPVVRMTRRACAARRCSLTFTARDSGGPAVAAVVSFKRLTGCKRGARGARCRKAKTLVAKRISAGVFSVRTARLAPARYRFTAIATDAAGSRSQAVSVVLNVKRR